METQIRKLAEQQMKMLDDACRKAIIGSKITDLTMEPVKGTKHMFMLTIRTDATPVPDKNAMICCNEIRVKVKM